MKPEIDTTHAPVYLVRWWPDLEVQELREHFEEIIALVGASPTPVGFVMDMTRSGRSVTLLRVPGSEGLKLAYAAIGRRVVGVAHVMPEPLARSMMSVIYWLVPPPFPTEMVGTVDAGLEWVMARLPQLHGSPPRAAAQ